MRPNTQPAAISLRDERSISNNCLAETGIIDEGSAELAAGPSTACSDRDALLIERPDIAVLRILDSVKEMAFRLSNITTRMRQAYAANNDLSKAVTPESALMKRIFTDAANSCSRGDEIDPMKRDGPPLREWQDTYGFVFHV